MFARVFLISTQLSTDESGTLLAEYALLVVLIALVCIGAVQIMGSNLSTFYANIAAAPLITSLSASCALMRIPLRN